EGRGRRNAGPCGRRHWQAGLRGGDDAALRRERPLARVGVVSRRALSRGAAGLRADDGFDSPPPGHQKTRAVHADGSIAQNTTQGEQCPLLSEPKLRISLSNRRPPTDWWMSGS